MHELQKRLDQLMLRIDHMGLRCEQALLDALDALDKRDIDAGDAVNANDEMIDSEEVAIEQECIRLLALHQPTAVDLRTLCTVIKVNSDLERIADLAAGIAKRVRRVVADQANPESYPEYTNLRQLTLDTLGRTIRLLNATESSAAMAVISSDQEIDIIYKNFIESILATRDKEPARLMTLIQLAKAFERIGDHCTNIAEDIVFLRTGDIIRHVHTS